MVCAMRTNALAADEAATADTVFALHLLICAVCDCGSAVDSSGGKLSQVMGMDRKDNRYADYAVHL